MDNKKTGGSAYPIAGDDYHHDVEGMTLLDYFAGQLASSWFNIIAERGISGELIEELDIADDDSDATNKAIAKLSYRNAKAMLEEKQRIEAS